MIVQIQKVGPVLVRVVPDGNFWNIEAKRYQMPLKVRFTPPWWYTKRVFGRFTSLLCRPRWLKWRNTGFLFRSFQSEGEGNPVRYESKEEALADVYEMQRVWA